VPGAPPTQKTRGASSFHLPGARQVVPRLTAVRPYYIHPVISSLIWFVGPRLDGPPLDMPHTTPTPVLGGLFCGQHSFNRPHLRFQRREQLSPLRLYRNHTPSQLHLVGRRAPLGVEVRTVG